MNNLVINPVEKSSEPILQIEGGVTQPTRVVPYTARVAILVSMALMIVAEIITVYIGVLPGAIFYSLLLVGLIIAPYFSSVPAVHRLYLAFVLIPLLRILSLVMPVSHAAPYYQYALIGVPLLVASLLVARSNGLRSIRLNLTWVELLVQSLFGLSGILLGLLASVILQPSPILTISANWALNILLGIVLTLFGAVTEEIIFRGVVQKALSSLFGFFSVFLGSILYASMFLGTLSAGYVLFYGFTGLLFAVWVQFSDSLWGAILAHGLMNIVFLLLVTLH